MADHNEQQLREEKNRFLRVGAHQLRSPLATIHTQLKTILDGYTEEVPAKMRLLLEGAERKIRDLLRTINEMLELSRLAERDRQAAMDPVDLERLVTEVRESVEMKARGKAVEIKVTIPKPLPPVWGITESLRHFLFNLWENAVKYTPAGGQVEVQLTYKNATRKFEGIISDSGIGIPKEHQQHLFQEFFRAPNAKKEEREGTGLGLAIVKAVIDFYGGEITCASEPGQGTTFAFSIPLARATGISLKKFREKPEQERLRIIIIGGRTAGPKAAAKARRKDTSARILIIEKESLLSYAGCGLPYYLSGQVHTPQELMATLDGDNRDQDFFRRVKGIKVYNRAEAVAIKREEKAVEVVFSKTGERRRLHYDRLILATGGKPIKPKLEGLELENIFTLTRLEDALGLRRALARFRAKEAVIIGGGLLGIECAEAVASSGMRVTITEGREHILSILDPEMSLLVENHFRNHGVRVYPDSPAIRLEGEGGVVKRVITKDSVLPADLVIIAAGVRPETALARNAGLAIGVTGAIAVNEYLQTNDPDIFAIGDCVENTGLITGNKVYLPLGSIADKHGRVAGINAVTLNDTFPGVVGTFLIKGFDYNIGVTGLTESRARAAGFDPVSVLVAGPDREHYYPETKSMAIKIIGDRKTMRLLGVQAVGPGEVSKRIDVAATVLGYQGTVDDLSKLDLGYAPPYSSAMDIIITAANVFKNKWSGRFQGISSIQLKEKLDAGESLAIVDVRNPEEYDRESLPGAISIPLRSLRGRLHELDRELPIVLICSIGINAYEAARVLAYFGFTKVQVLEGGIFAWPFAKR